MILSPSSVGSYIQAAEHTAPPQREPQQGVRERDEQRNATRKIESDPGEGRGVKVDFQA